MYQIVYVFLKKKYMIESKKKILSYSCSSTGSRKIASSNIWCVGSRYYAIFRNYIFDTTVFPVDILFFFP